MNYHIELEVFKGPMDLLLYLVSKEEVDVTEVSIARIVDQYMAYLERLRELNVDVTSDFLVMASTLMLIKSRMLLPMEEIDLEEEIDPQDSLIQHLLEYKKFKVLSRTLRERAERRARRCGRPRNAAAGEEEVSIEDADLWDLLRAFARIVRETGLDRTFQVIHADKPIRLYIAAILDTLRARKSVAFDAIFEEKRTRDDVVCFFVGILELAKRKVVRVFQEEETGEIRLSLVLEDEKLAAIQVDGVYRLDMLLADEDGVEHAAEKRVEQAVPEEDGAGMETVFPGGTASAPRPSPVGKARPEAREEGEGAEAAAGEGDA